MKINYKQLSVSIMYFVSSLVTAYMSMPIETCSNESIVMLIITIVLFYAAMDTMFPKKRI